MKRSKMFAALAALVLGLSLIAAEAQAAAVLNTGYNSAAVLTGHVEYDNFPGGVNNPAEIGVRGATGNAATGDVVWGTPVNKAVTFSYNGAGTLSATVAGSNPATILKTGLTLGTLNYLEIEIGKHNSTGSISLSNVTLVPGGGLPSFTVTNPTDTHWNVTGIDLTAGFTLSGTITISTLSGGAGTNYVRIHVGYVAPPADTDAPIVTSVAIMPVPVIINGQATVTAHVDDSTTGHHNIKSAEYSLNDGVWTAMSAQDGAFDEEAEDVTATFTAYVLGPNNVCVRGTDELDNMSDGTACQSFLVTYKFDGFFSPIENDFMNMAKAGQAIPAKWRLTDAYDVPIFDPASFVGLYSYEIVCGQFSDPIDEVEEIASGNSGLQYLGDGYWQFNWKTPKNYANTCRAMYVEFNSTALSPIVKFQFKK